MISLYATAQVALLTTPFYLGDHTLNCHVPQVQADMYLDSRDLGIVGHLCRGRGWEPHVTQFFLKALKPHWVVVDVGANFGWYTMHFARHASAAGGKVVAVEANPRTFSLLSATVENSGVSSVALHNVAVSNRAGTAVFSNDPARALNNHIVDSTNATRDAVRVRTRTLDDILADERRVDFIKIDVEGFEALAWAGVQETLQRHPGCKLVIEVNTPRMLARTSVDPRTFYDQLLAFSRTRRLRVLTETGSVSPISIEKLLQGGEYLVVLGSGTSH